ncbi:MAG: alpha/beta hydrolase family protein [Granulosicoccus sp.]
MKKTIAIFCSLIIGSINSVPAQAVGFARVPPSPNKIFDMGIWYPTDQPVPSTPNTPFGQALSIDVKPVGSDLPLIIISHGNAGWMGGHADTALALAEAGYVVAALTHSDDNFENEDVNPSVWVVSRPQEVISSIAYLLERWSGAEHISRKRIGVFGFSAGGYTALVAAGGVPNFQKAMQHCEREPTEFVCDIGLIQEIASSGLKSTSRSFASDPRIKAISIAAPGFGFAFDSESVQAVKIPVQIWSGSLDMRVPHGTNGRLVANALNGETDVEIVEGAGHFSFLQPCKPGLESENQSIWEMICVDDVAFDRAAFHKYLNARVIEFFDTMLVP